MILLIIQLVLVCIISERDCEISEVTIGLSIIVKDESHVIERMLESVYPILDYYTIVDTGSSDNTKEICRKFMQEKGIPGQILDHVWENFAVARNVALEAARDKTTHVFWLDADEEVILDPDFSLAKLKTLLQTTDVGAVNVLTEAGGSYSRTQFIRCSKPFYFAGPVHEGLEYRNKNEWFQNNQITGMKVLTHPDGHSYKEGEEKKNYKRSLLLEDYIKDPENLKPRWVFYLAESCRSGGRLEDAIKYYRQRLEMTATQYPDQFMEEHYFSQLSIGKISKLLNYSTSKVTAEFLKCNNLDRLRAEHLNELISLYGYEDDYYTAFIFSQFAFDKFHGRNPYPERYMMVTENLYEWRFAQKHAKVSIVLNRLDEAYRALRKLVAAVQLSTSISEKDRKEVQLLFTEFCRINPDKCSNSRQEIEAEIQAAREKSGGGNMRPDVPSTQKEVPIIQQQQQHKPAPVKIVNAENEKRSAATGGNEICLLMVVKNLESTILQTLSSVLPLIDRFVIVDLDSTDRTVQLLQDFLITRNRIPGRVLPGFEELGIPQLYNLAIAKSSMLFEGHYMLMKPGDVIKEDWTKVPVDRIAHFKEFMKQADCWTFNINGVPDMRIFANDNTFSWADVGGLVSSNNGLRKGDIKQVEIVNLLAQEKKEKKEDPFEMFAFDEL